MRSRKEERIRNCPVCQVVFTPSASNVARGWGICCSAECRNRYKEIQKKENIVETFWAKVNKTESCWLWTGSLITNSKGMCYGEFKLGKLLGGDKGSRARVRAHRFSWELVHGPVPEEMCVLHNCPGGDNPLCVNPTHLFLGTRTENMLDMHAKGRYVEGPHPFGEDLPQSKLNEEKVHKIDKLTAEGWTTYQIGDLLGVSNVCINNVVRRKTWKHIPKLT